jgi:hypothetical protein
LAAQRLLCRALKARSKDACALFDDLDGVAGLE